MTASIRRKVVLSAPREVVWQQIATAAGLTEWMYPNDFVAKVGHHFEFRIPANPSVGFEGLVVSCEVLECSPPEILTFSWSAGGPVDNTKVIFRLESIPEGTCLHFEHSGFDLEHPFGKSALGGAKLGWEDLFKRLGTAVMTRHRGTYP